MIIVQKEPNICMYVKGYLYFLLRHKNYVKRIVELEKNFSELELQSIEERVNYYNKINSPIDKSIFINKVEDLRKPKTPKAYYFDTNEYAKNFPQNLPIQFLFGDIIHVPNIPSIVKSRPIVENNENSILLKLDKARHFVYVKNDKPFLTKKNILIGRCSVYQEHRIKFYEKYFGNPLCDLGQVNKEHGNINWLKPKISIKKHLEYKFILSLQGNDVATNLKWIMSSNSIAVLPKPTIETWFMEGVLKAGEHYIEINDDYSNLEEILNYYIKNPKECQKIIENANRFCLQFKNKNKEDLISLLVLKKFLVN